MQPACGLEINGRYFVLAPYWWILLSSTIFLIFNYIFNVLWKCFGRCWQKSEKEEGLLSSSDETFRNMMRGNIVFFNIQFLMHILHFIYIIYDELSSYQTTAGWWQYMFIYLSFLNSGFTVFLANLFMALNIRGSDYNSYDVLWDDQHKMVWLLVFSTLLVCPVVFTNMIPISFLLIFSSIALYYVWKCFLDMSKPCCCSCDNAITTFWRWLVLKLVYVIGFVIVLTTMFNTSVILYKRGITFKGLFSHSLITEEFFARKTDCYLKSIEEGALRTLAQITSWF
jgi:hypothetical protein